MTTDDGQSRLCLSSSYSISPEACLNVINNTLSRLMVLKNFFFELFTRGEPTGMDHKQKRSLVLWVFQLWAQQIKMKKGGNLSTRSFCLPIPFWETSQGWFLYWIQKLIIITKCVLKKGGQSFVCRHFLSVTSSLRETLLSRYNLMPVHADKKADTTEATQLNKTAKPKQKVSYLPCMSIMSNYHNEAHQMI